MYSVNQELVDRLSIAPDAFTGQTALVTGGALGIGEATATTLAALDARVVVIDRLPAGEDVAAAIRAIGGDAEFIACDISDVDQLNDVIAQIGETVGAVDILINNALHAHAAPVVSLELEDWEKTFATNARAPFLLTKAMLPGMLERHRGVVVNMVAYEGSPLAAAYSGTKSALRSLATTVAREIGNESGVWSFSFVPGIVDTPLMRDKMIPQVAAAFGLSEEETVAIVAHNPGYDGFMPVDHCATALVYAGQSDILDPEQERHRVVPPTSVSRPDMGDMAEGFEHLTWPPDWIRAAFRGLRGLSRWMMSAS